MVEEFKDICFTIADRNDVQAGIHLLTGMGHGCYPFEALFLFNRQLATFIGRQLPSAFVSMPNLLSSDAQRESVRCGDQRCMHDETT
jgi:hypothetical protein